MRKMRGRKRAAAPPLMFERADYQLFMRPETLPQKAGCSPHQIGRVVLTELGDNALDNGAKVGIVRPLDAGVMPVYQIIDSGTGIDPAEIPRLFAVNRSLLSSKLKRLPLRGMLGNGLRVVMGAVAAYNGTIAVTSRGRRLSLAVDPISGTTRVITDEPVPMQPGTMVEIGLVHLGGCKPVDLSIRIAHEGQQYRGPSRPAWDAALSRIVDGLDNEGDEP